MALGYVLLSLLLGRGLGDDFAHWLNYDIYNHLTFQQGVISHELHLLPLFLGVTTLLILPFIWFRLFSWSPVFICLALFYLAGLLSSLMLTMSPTIFASAHRVFFIPDMMMIAVILLLFMESLQYLNKKGKFFILCCLTLAVAAINDFIKLL